MSSENPTLPPPLNEGFQTEEAPPHIMDALWERGWRHFGRRFYRYNYYVFQGEVEQIIALRTDLSAFKLSKSQRRILRKNSDLRMLIQPVQIDEQKEAMFLAHRERFEEYVPESLRNFLSERPATLPCTCVEIGVYDMSSKLLAVSFLDVGAVATSSVFAMFDPKHEKRRLGIYTMLLEIAYSRNTQKQFYYSGYATIGSSAYDYKKCFHALSSFDFETGWQPFERQCR